ncbi:uncharacterized protein LOC134275563 [Saccostrea cucullata]|uniref:uncharacterized protein LOC134275563 n=1 Tax=Saccostrea cuccullata TaxID=36930 RepID=UPI002ED494FE
MGTKKLSSGELSDYLSQCRELLLKSESTRVDFDNESLNDEDYMNLTGINKQDFEALCSQIHGLRQKKYSKKTVIGILLTKLRTGLSSTVLKTIFNIKKSKCVCQIVKRARTVLMDQFVPKYMGLNHITRDEIISKHTTIFARELLASGDDDTAILLVDGTYIYIEKSAKYSFQRRSFSMYKGRPLVKPMMFVASDGYIVDILGPYLADGKNNDANILNKTLLKDDALLNWLKEDDIFVLDRGFRDSLDVIESVGLRSESPYFLGKGEKQHSLFEANTSRLVTKIRWAVESANGRLKRWKFLANVVTNTQIPFIGDYVRIVGSLINAFRPSLASDSDDHLEISRKMLEKSKITTNPLKDLFINSSGKRILSNKMSKIDAADAVPDFPKLSENYLRSLTFGIYQIKQASSYSREHLDEEGGYEIFVTKTMSNILQAKIQSRHVSSKSYYLWIQFDASDEEDPIKYWYCQCKSGARLVGSCAHVASVLWYIGVQRHADTELQSQIMPDSVLDCAKDTDTDISSSSSDDDSEI